MEVRSLALTTILSRDNQKEALSLETAYDTHGAGLYRFALALTRSEADAEDAVQDVFLRIAQRPAALGEARSPRAYLYFSVRNACFTIIKRRKHFQESDLDAGGGDKVSDGNHLLVRREMLLLPIEQCEVIVLKVYDGMTFDEISAVLEISKNTAASRYRYGIGRLRNALEETDES